MDFLLNQDLHKKLCHFTSLKAIQILEVLSSSMRYHSISEIAGITGLSISTVHRILQELCECGYAEKNDEQKLYRIGFSTKALAMQFDTSDYLVEIAYSEMKRLNDLSKETIHLVSLDSFQGIYIGKMEAQNQIGLRSRVGKAVPLYCTGVGKAILAFQPQEWLANYLCQVNRKKYTANTITEEAALLKEMELVRVRGYSLDNREHNQDIVCIAAPIYGNNNKVFSSIGVSAPDYRFSLEKALSYADELLVSASAISKLLQKGHD